MRLLQRSECGAYTIKNHDSAPPYAILSHTWGADDDEIQLHDLPAGPGSSKPGYAKIQFCGGQAHGDGLHYFWVDTCCIDKTNSVELQEAITSMYRWYRNADKCYAYLVDVSCPAGEADRHAWISDFRSSRWFRRGWTLQELLAPVFIEFFSREGTKLGDRRTLEHLIVEITKIPTRALQNSTTATYSTQEVFAWQERRETKRKEDKAYSLLGICGVYMPLIYGEGEESALRRLRKELHYASTGNYFYNLYTRDYTVTHEAESQGEESRKYAIRHQVTELKNLLPFPRNRNFTGRDDQLDELQRLLFVDGYCQRVALAGLGGVGKTQIALELAYRVKAQRSVFWVPALSVDSWQQAYASIARLLQISVDAEKTIAEAVQMYLSREDTGSWLLIVDNADDAEVIFGSDNGAGLSLDNYLPHSSQGSVLFTTRDLKLATDLAGSETVELEEMNEIIAHDLFINSLRNKELCKQEPGATADLLDELTYLPLAITQAAAFINSTKSSVQAYLALLRGTESSKVATLSRDFRDRHRYKEARNPVAMTWLVSFNRIRRENPLAADLLSFMSCLDAKAIPDIILSPASEENRAFALDTLIAYSFISKRSDGTVFDLHRLVHLAARAWIQEAGEAANWTEEVVKRVHEVFPNPQHKNREIRSRLLTHAQRILDSEGAKKYRERWKLCKNVAHSLYMEGRGKEAIQRFEEVETWSTMSLAENDEDRLAVQHELAIVYVANGQHRRAMQLLEHVIKIQDATLAEGQLRRLASQHVLAIAYRDTGQITQAIQLLEHIVKIQDIIAEDHPDRLASQHTLATAYYDNGQITQAIQLLEYVIKIKDTLAEDHPRRLASQHTLAMAYRKNGQIIQAIQLLEHVVKIQDTLAEDHPERLRSQHALAITYRKNGQITQAIQLLEHVVKIKDTLAEDHSGRLSSQHALAMTYRKNGQIIQAIQLLEHVVKIQDTLAEDHPGRLASQHALAIAYYDNGQITPAIQLLEHVVKIRDVTLAEDHPTRLSSQNALAALVSSYNKLSNDHS